MTRAAKHRHAVDSGYQRGEETRMRIVAAAIKLFGEQGFEGASTRDIATSAGVNAPALQYYFNNKEGVYLACVEHIVSQIWESLSGVVEAAEHAVARGASEDELIEAFCEIQAQLAEFMFTSRCADDWRLFMARQQAGSGPTAGFQIIYQRVSKRMSEVTATIVGRLLGCPANDDETLIRTMALNGQLMVFQVARRSVLTKLNWDSINAERLALIKRVLREQTAALLRWMLSSRAMDATAGAGDTSVRGAGVTAARGGGVTAAPGAGARGAAARGTGVTVARGAGDTAARGAGARRSVRPRSVGRRG